VYVDRVTDTAFQWVVIERLDEFSSWIACAASPEFYDSWVEAWRAGSAAVYRAVPDTQEGPQISDAISFL